VVGIDDVGLAVSLVGVLLMVGEAVTGFNVGTLVVGLNVIGNFDGL